ncbi:MAG: DUF1800 domain-containing protein [Bacteroidia bacterium]
MATNKKSRTNSGISQYTGVWNEDTVRHLLRRAHFGVKVEDVATFKAKTMSQAVDDILDIDYTVPSPPVNYYESTNPDPRVNLGDTWVDDYNSQLNNVRMRSFKRWWAGQIVNHDSTIREKMVLFWHNHFSTQTQVYGWPNFGYDYLKLIRSNCLKNFKTLTKDMTTNPAMLVFLNGERNTKTAPDENYSRELQELFTLGKGPDSKYTEDDVIAGARVLTGWRVRRTDGTSYFQSNRHDEGDKKFSSFYNDTIITGKTGNAGADEVDDLLNMIFAQNEVAKHIVRKLYRWFIYYEIDSDTETNVITPLANIFRSNSYEIKPVLEALFKSQHFYDVANRHALLKSPADFTFGLARSFDIDFPAETEYNSLYTAWNFLLGSASSQQQNLGDPPSVAGWSPYYQIPQYHELWINSDTLPKRNQITDRMIASGYNINGFRFKIDTLQYAAKFPNPEDPNKLIDDMLTHLHTLEVSQKQKDYMKTILLSGQINDSYWTDAWNSYVADPTNTSKATTVSSRLIFLVKYLMNLGEFQLS